MNNVPRRARFSFSFDWVPGGPGPPLTGTGCRDGRSSGRACFLIGTLLIGEAVLEFKFLREVFANIGLRLCYYLNKIFAE